MRSKRRGQSFLVRALVVLSAGLTVLTVGCGSKRTNDGYANAIYQDCLPVAEQCRSIPKGLCPIKGDIIVFDQDGLDITPDLKPREPKVQQRLATSASKQATVFMVASVFTREGQGYDDGSKSLFEVAEVNVVYWPEKRPAGRLEFVGEPPPETRRGYAGRGDYKTGIDRFIEHLFRDSIKFEQMRAAVRGDPWNVRPDAGEYKDLIRRFRMTSPGAAPWLSDEEWFAVAYILAVEDPSESTIEEIVLVLQRLKDRGYFKSEAKLKQLQSYFSNLSHSEKFRILCKDVGITP